LIDLAGHTGLNRLPLYAKRLAPVQINYLGYPNTTGLKAMNYRFVDALTDPDERDQAVHTEKLVRFAPFAWSYQPPASAPDPVRAPHDGVVFGSFNNPAKISSSTLALWARVLASVPSSTLLLKGQGLDHAIVRPIVETRLKAAGIDLSRVEMFGRTRQQTSHLELYQRIDIALDAFPYHGTTTTCEALWMGVPVISLRGDRHASRVGASLLTSVGHPEWIAETPDQYVEIATKLAHGPSRTTDLRQSLRGEVQHSPLLDHAAHAKAFGQALRECWQRTE
jgi:predicted O-linked N-acetylglucosamine transferase (SPINDLY family)